MSGAAARLARVRASIQEVECDNTHLWKVAQVLDLIHKLSLLQQQSLLEERKAIIDDYLAATMQPIRLESSRQEIQEAMHAALANILPPVPPSVEDVFGPLNSSSVQRATDAQRGGDLEARTTQELPPGWAMTWNEQHECHDYFNRGLGQVQWEEPAWPDASIAVTAAPALPLGSTSSAMSGPDMSQLPQTVLAQQDWVNELGPAGDDCFVMHLQL